MRLPDLLEAGKVHPADVVWFSKAPDKAAKLTKDGRCVYNGSEMSLLQWTKDISGRSAVNIYNWVIHGPTKLPLEDLRVQLEQELKSEQDEERAAVDGAGPPTT